MRLGDRPELGVRPATTDDVPALAGAMARAFEDDPVYEWFLPDPSTRLRRMIALNEAMFPRFFPIDFVEVMTTSNLGGIAMWCGPERWEPPNRAMLGALPKVLRNIGFAGARKMMSAMGAMKKVHPREPHWYLMGLGTDPPHQRTGVGSALVTSKLEECDRQHLGAYLETQKAINVPYYERFGFRVTGEIDLPKGGPHLWLMWRDPH
jgi:ribosomal protein S18 acetylase RimI-like enzyme